MTHPESMLAIPCEGILKNNLVITQPTVRLHEAS